MQVTVQDVMTRSPIAVPTETTIEQVLDTLVTEGVPSVYVTTHENRLAGIVTDYEVLKHQVLGGDRTQTAETLMNRNVPTVRPEERHGGLSPVSRWPVGTDGRHRRRGSPGRQSRPPRRHADDAHPRTDASRNTGPGRRHAAMRRCSSGSAAPQCAVGPQDACPAGCSNGSWRCRPLNPSRPFVVGSDAPVQNACPPFGSEPKVSVCHESLPHPARPAPPRHRLTPCDLRVRIAHSPGVAFRAGCVAAVPAARSMHDNQEAVSKATMGRGASGQLARSSSRTPSRTSWQLTPRY